MVSVLLTTFVAYLPRVFVAIIIVVITSAIATGVKGLIEVQIGLDGLVFAQSRKANFPSMSERDIYAALAADPFGRGKNTA